MLGQRELSEAQIRQRLTRRGYDPDTVDAAVARLVEERAIDDDRSAAAIARIETGVRKRGRGRVRSKIERAGISRAAAKRAMDDVFGDLDDDELLESALARRLKRGTAIGDQRQFNRIYRYLVGQGFEPQRVLAKLRGRRTGHVDHEDE
jgi:regulatory protein